MHSIYSNLSFRIFVMLCWMLVSVIQARAQMEVVFRVSAPPVIDIAPHYDTLIAGQDYSFYVTGKKAQEVKDIVFSGGQVWLTDSLIVVEMAKELPVKGKAVMRLYTERNGKKKKIFEKFYIVKEPDKLPSASRGPLSFWWWTQNRSTRKWLMALKEVDSLSLIRVQGDWVNIFDNPTSSVWDSKYVVNSMKVTMYSGEKVDSFSASKGSFTQPMLATLAGLKVGDKIVVKEIKYHLASSPDVMTGGPFTIHINKAVD